MALRSRFPAPDVIDPPPGVLQGEIYTDTQSDTDTCTCLCTYTHTTSHTHRLTRTQSRRALTILLSAGHLIKSLKLIHTFTPSCASNTHMNQDYVRSMLCQMAYGYHL